MKIVPVVVFLLLVLIFGIGYALVSSKSKISPESIVADTIMSKKPDLDIATSKRDSIVAFAIQFIGTPYVYGSCDADGFDCSGFVYFVFKHFNIEVPRSSSEYKDFGKKVDLEKMRKGDVLVFLGPTSNVIGHLGLVTEPKGMETVFIHSSSGKEMQVIFSSLKQKVYKKRFVRAVRVL